MRLLRRSLARVLRNQFFLSFTGLERRKQFELGLDECRVRVRVRARAKLD